MVFRNKAVSDGAISFYHGHFVRTRISKFTYGSFSCVTFDPTDPDHQQRFHNTYTSASGTHRIRDVFSAILPKVCSFSVLVARGLIFINLSSQNTQVSETKEFRKTYWHQFTSNDKFQTASFSLWCYRGAVVKPRWKDVDTGKSLFCKLQNISLTGSVENYTRLCKLEIDISQLPMSRRNTRFGKGTYYCVHFDIVLLFGLTEFKAVVAWKQNVGSILVS